MTRRLDIQPQAQQDLVELANYLAQQSEALSQRFLQAASVTFDFLLTFPFAGSPWESDNPRLANFRFKPVDGFPNHLVFYHPGDETLEIVRVLHGSRDLESLFGS